MNSGDDVLGQYRRPERNRFVRPLGIALAVAAVLFIAIRLWAVVWLDALWYRSVGASEVFRARYGTQILLVVVFTAIFFVASSLSLFAAEGRVASLRVPTDGNDFLDRYHFVVGNRHRLVLLGASAVLGLVAGLPAASMWKEWLLFTHGAEVGVSDPLFGFDVGYYLFTLPFVQYLLGWVAASVATITIATVGTYYLNGGIRWQGADSRFVSSRVKAHLSILAAIFAVTKGLEYFFVDRPMLTLGQNKVFDGAGYAAVNAKLPALMLLVLVSFFSASLLIANVWRKGTSLPIVAGVLWIVVAVLAGTLYPTLVQRFRVDPQKAKEEIPFIARNQRATLAAYGLDTTVDVEPLDVTGQLTAASVERRADSLSRVPILDPAVMPETFQRLRGEPVLSFNSVDLDRYELGGVSRPVVIGARNLLVDQIANGSMWEQRHLVYTHAKGIAVAPADEVTSDGRPSFIEQQSTEARNAGLRLDSPQIYFNEYFADWYAIVNSGRASYDKAKFEAKTGIPLSSMWRRLALSVSTGDVDPMISSYIDADSQLLLRRSVEERVASIAPFLSMSSDPYPVVADGRLLYVVEGFTTASTYPYSQFEATDELSRGAGRTVSVFNYIRNSVKVTVDAYDGSVHLYRIDEMSGPSDPVLDTWASVFPDLFESASDMPVGLADHLRYPDELLKVQSRILGRYHTTDPEAFYDRSKDWLIASDPGTLVKRNSTEGSGTVAVDSSDGPTPAVSIYLTLPNDDEPSYVRLLPFTPGSDRKNTRAELTAFLVADQDAASYGDLTLFEVTSVDANGERQSGAGVEGPNTVQSTINGEEDISDDISLLNGNGSQVMFGAMTLVPVDNTIVWIRPFFLKGQGGSDAYPGLRKIIAVSGGKAVMDDDVAGALDQLTGQRSSTTPSDRPKNPAELIAEAGSLLDEGQAALATEGGLAVYQKNQDEARRLIDEALVIMRSASGPSGASGIAGESGTEGESGVDGAAGSTVGDSGPSGVSGPSGR